MLFSPAKIVQLRCRFWRERLVCGAKFRQWLAGTLADLELEPVRHCIARPELQPGTRSALSLDDADIYNVKGNSDILARQN